MPIIWAEIQCEHDCNSRETVIKLITFETAYKNSKENPFEKDILVF